MSYKGRSHDNFTLEIVFRRQKTQAIQYITKHIKVIVSVHLEKLKNQVHVSSLHQYRYMPIIIHSWYLYHATLTRPVLTQIESGN